MSFFDDVIGAAKSVGSAVSAFSAPLGGVLGLLGGRERNEAQADQAASANAFSAQQYATRYQTTVADMKAAGINPMLAYGSGPGNAPSGQQASVENVSSSAAQAAMTAAQVANVAADTRNKEATTANIEADTRLKEAQTGQSSSTAAVNSKQLELIDATVANLKEQIVLTSRNANNAAVQNQVLGATVRQLEEQAKLLSKQGATQLEIQEQLRATVDKLKSETQLNLLDINAALKFDNFGREFQQYRPIIELLKHVLGRGR